MKPKRILAMFLAIVMVVGLIPGVAVTASATTITPVKPYGEGTETNPYKIGTAGELYWYATNVNTKAAVRSSYAELTADITVNSSVLKTDGTLSENASSFVTWTAIGNGYSTACTGHFDGKGYTIRGLYLEMDPKTSNYVGFIGHAGDGAVIKNVTVEDSYFSGMSGIGGIIGQTASKSTVTVENCHNGATVVSHTIGNGGHAGGIIGNVSSTANLKDCTNHGVISVNTDYASTKNETSRAGGIVGTGSTLTFENCHNSGSVTGVSWVGGIAGYAGYSVNTTECSNTGTITGNDLEGVTSSGKYVGGIIGYINKSNECKITDCYNAGSLQAYQAGGIVGGSFNAKNITNCHNYGEMKATTINPFAPSSKNCSNSYYLDTITSKIEDAAKTATEFANGTVVDLLNAGRTDADAVWVQGEKYPVFKHTHNWKYELVGTDTIKATCTAIGCPNKDGSVTIAASDSLVYTGSAIEAKVINTLKTDDTVTVVYTPDNKLTDGKPINAGTYTASITIGGKTAYAEYTIEKAEATAPNGLTAVYGQTLANVSLPNDWNWADSTANVGDVGTQTHKANYEGDNNHNAANNVDVTVTVSRSGATMTANADKSKYAYGETVKITVNGITPTGIAPIGLFALTAPTTNQVAIWNGDTQLTEPQTVTESALTFDVTGLNVGDYTLTAKFTGNGNMAATSSNVSVSIEQAEPNYTPPTGLTATYGDTLENVTLPDADNGVWTWETPADSVGNVGTQTHKAIFTPKDITNYKAITVDVPIKVAKATINSVSFNVTVPEASATPQSSVAGGTGYTADIKWNTPYSTFGFNTAYTATVTLKADSNHKFADEISVGGWNKSEENDVLTFVKTFDKTREAKLTGYTAPSITNNTFSEYHENSDSAITELPTTVTYQTESGEVSVNIELSCDNYNPEVNATNSFIWSVKNGELSNYDRNDIATTGSITVTNASAVIVTHSKEDKKITYNGITYDVSQMFTNGTTTGAVSYEVVSGGTGAGTLNGKMLTITKAGTINVKMSTAADKQYAASDITATLTVKKANGTGTVSMTGWTYGKTASTPVVSGNKGKATYQYKVKGTDDSTYSGTKPSNAGNYTVKATFAATDLYNESSATADFTIDRRELTPSISGTVSKVYDGTSDVPSGHSLTIALSGIVNNNDVSATASFAYSGADVGTTEIKVTNITLTGNESVNYKLSTTEATANAGTITKAESSVTTEPTKAENLVYTGEEFSLITADGVAIGGTIKYSVDGENFDYAFEDIPKFKDAKDDYKVWYKVVGDNNHNDTTSVCIEISVAKKPINTAITLTAPVKNATPQTSIETDEYTATVVWSPEIAEGGTFAKSTEYTATITITPKTNYTVSGIAENGYTLDGATSVTNEAGSNNVVTAAFSKTAGSSGGGVTRYTVKFNTNGGNTLTSQTVKKNTAATEPTEPTKDGYVFDGWYTDSNFTTEYDFDTKVTKNITLYAKWTEDEIQEPSDDKKDDEQKPTTDEWKNPFTDVMENDWYFDNVKYANENGLMSGITNSTFAPNENITRGMFVTVLYRAEGEPAVNKSIPFADVNASQYYANAVIWAEQNDIVKGVSETEFAPDENITREQIATIIYRYAEYKGIAPTGAWAIKLDYADSADISGYAVEGVMYCTMKNIMQGKDNNMFAPKDNATRAEIAAILGRFIESNK